MWQQQLGDSGIWWCLGCMYGFVGVLGVWCDGLICSLGVLTGSPSSTGLICSLPLSPTLLRDPPHSTRHIVTMTDTRTPQQYQYLPSSPNSTPRHTAQANHAKLGRKVHKVETQELFFITRCPPCLLPILKKMGADPIIRVSVLPSQAGPNRSIPSHVPSPTPSRLFSSVR